MRRLAAVVAALGLAACGGGASGVTRVVDGRVMDGRFVMPVSYELFLRGSLAEERGGIDEAVAAFEQAARFDPDDPLVWTRLAGARCKKNTHDERIAKELARALQLDPDFGPALALQVSCSGGGEREARRALQAEPASVDLAIAMQRFLAEHRTDDDARERLVALTAQHPENSSWRALFEWASVHQDDVLALAAAKELARSRDDAPALVAMVKSRAGDGAVAAARLLAALLLDAGESRIPAAAADALVVRLAVDEALSRGDEDAAVRRATRARLGLALVGARALALGQPAIAGRLASLVTRADPNDTAARMVLAACGEAVDDRKEVAAAFAGVSQPSPVPAEVALVFARAIARATTDSSARVFASASGDFLGTDAVMVTLAVDLAARGAIPDVGLPNEARIELALRQRSLADTKWTGELDARHRLLSLAWTKPTEGATRDLALRLSTRSPRDPLVGAALVHIALATGQTVDGGVLGMLESLSPSDPIAIGAALDALKAKGSQKDLTAARTRLAAIAATPAERALSSF